MGKYLQFSVFSQQEEHPSLVKMFQLPNSKSEKNIGHLCSSFSYIIILPRS